MPIPAPRSPVPLLAALAVAATWSGPGAAAPRRVNGAPTLSANHASGDVVRVAELTRIEVQATDPDGDRVSLRLAAVPPGMVYAPVLDAAGTAVLTVEWRPATPGPIRLVFDAVDDGAPPATSRLELDLVIEDRSPIQLGDVTGDGVPDLVAPASRADVNGVAGAGALHVWSGANLASGVPVASLYLPVAAGPANLPSVDSGAYHNNYADESGVRLVDVTGDGTLDVVAVACKATVDGVPRAGLVAVWEGGATLVGQPAPRALLRRTEPFENDRLGDTGWFRAGLFVRDFDGDGVGDVIVASPTVGEREHVVRIGQSPETIPSVGEVHVWWGGAALAGERIPDRTIGLAFGEAYDAIGAGELAFGDVTGDGFEDLVATGPGRGFGKFEQDRGVVFVWPGGPRAAATTPTQLRGPNVGDRLSAGFRTQLVDVTGDGIRDVVTGSQVARVAGKDDAGAVFVWAGGDELTAQPVSSTPTATLVSATPGANDYAGTLGTHLLDVTGDGVLDVVSGSSYAWNAGAQESGEVLVWTGPIAPGTWPADATLNHPDPAKDDDLGEQNGVQFADVTGDGVLDVVIDTIRQVTSVGRIFVWAGGAGLAGDPDPTTELELDVFTTYNLLGTAGLRLGDVTGDGQLDVVSGSPVVNPGFVTLTGAIFVWAGGPGMSGVLAQDAVLTVPGAVSGDLLGSGRRMTLADLSGDGVLDVTSVAYRADEPGLVDIGRMYLWAGGAGLLADAPPTATLVSPFKEAGLQFGTGFTVRDVTGDGALDLTVWTPAADAGGVVDAGCIHLWSGGVAWSGEPAPTTTWLDPGALPFDGLGRARADAKTVRVLDANGDGVPDVLGVAGYADAPGGPEDVGRLYLWLGNAAGKTAPDHAFAVPGASKSDHLGS